MGSTMTQNSEPHGTSRGIEITDASIAELAREAEQGYAIADLTPATSESRRRFGLITVEPGTHAGQPCIRGLRIPVATVVEMVAAGMSVEEIVADLPDLEAEDVAEALRYAAETVREGHLPDARRGISLP